MCFSRFDGSAYNPFVSPFFIRSLLLPFPRKPFTEQEGALDKGGNYRNSRARHCFDFFGVITYESERIAFGTFGYHGFLLDSIASLKNEAVRTFLSSALCDYCLDVPSLYDPNVWYLREHWHKQYAFTASDVLGPDGERTLNLHQYYVIRRLYYFDVWTFFLKDHLRASGVETVQYPDSVLEELEQLAGAAYTWKKAENARLTDERAREEERTREESQTGVEDED